MLGMSISLEFSAASQEFYTRRVFIVEANGHSCLVECACGVTKSECTGVLVKASHGRTEYSSIDGSLKRLHVTHSDDKLIQKYGLMLQSRFFDFSLAGMLSTYTCR